MSVFSPVSVSVRFTDIPSLPLFADESDLYGFIIAIGFDCLTFYDIAKTIVVMVTVLKKTDGNLSYLVATAL